MKERRVEKLYWRSLGKWMTDVLGETDVRLSRLGSSSGSFRYLRAFGSAITLWLMWPSMLAEDEIM
jgi:hypothetical protein